MAMASIRMNKETRDRLRELARRTGMSQVTVVRALAFATAEESAMCAKRRLSQLSSVTGERSES